MNVRKGENETKKRKGATPLWPITHNKQRLGDMLPLIGLRIHSSNTLMNPYSVHSLWWSNHHEIVNDP